jgi:peptide/nickel transport system substrate-binding protein
VFRPRAQLVVGVAALVLLAGTGGCDGNGGGPRGDGARGGSAGGTLLYYVSTPYPHVDPQRIYEGAVISNLARTVYRQLVAFPISTDPRVSSTPVPDLATDVGTSTEGGRTWSFTVKDGVAWEDGRPITCEDFRYGASRIFATGVISGGPTYFLSNLDIPTDPATGLPAYKGPYDGQGQALFDRAVTCHGNTITYHFKRPWPDFPLAIASLHLADPYRRDKDLGAKSNFQVFSDGPYRVEGNTWRKYAGATLVRNENSDPSTDSTEIRKALPDEIRFDVGQTPEAINDRLIADHGGAEYAVTSEAVPPPHYSQVTGAVADRSAVVRTPYVTYLVPHFRTEAMSNPAVREALKVSTNVDGYIAALGGPRSGTPAESIVSPGVSGYRENPAFAGSSSGDVHAALRILADAGLRTPIPITFTYFSAAGAADNAAAALKDTWDRAGFDVTLDPEGGFYDLVGNPDKDTDVMWGGWGADWPNVMTVVPQLFDSRLNLTPESDGNDWGAYHSDRFNALVDKARAAETMAAQAAALRRADLVLGRDVAYIPLVVVRWFLLHGSKVTGYVNTPASSGYPDLGPIGVGS